MELKKLWWDKETIPKNTKSEGFIQIAKAACDALIEDLTSFREDAKRYEQMVHYRTAMDTSNMAGLKDKNYQQSFEEDPYLTFNVIQAAVETASNKIAKMRPKVTFLTKDADRERRETARRLDNWMVKLFKRGNVYKEAASAFTSACVTGVGVVKILYNEKAHYLFGKPKEGIEFKNVPVKNVFFDNSYRGPHEPTEMGEKCSYTLNELVALFPKKKKELESKYNGETDIEVYEAYKAHKRHTIFTDKIVLLDDVWEKGLPYVLFKWTNASEGVVGIGIAKKLYYLQHAITFTIQKIFKGIKTFSTQRIFIPKGSSPSENSLNDLPGQIVEYNPSPTGGPGIVFSTPPAANPQSFQTLELMWKRAFEVIGISQLSSTGQVPTGLKQASGIALRQYTQIENERFQLVRSSYEDTFIKIARKVIDIAPTTMSPKGVSKGDIVSALDSVTIWAASLLPETPAGRLALVADLLNAGMLTPNQTLSLLESPDTDKFLNSENARAKAVELEIERALEKGQAPPYRSALGLELYLDKTRKLLAEMVIEDDDKDGEKIALLEAFEAQLVEKVTQQAGMQAGLAQPAQGQQAPQRGSEPLPARGLEGVSE